MLLHEAAEGHVEVLLHAFTLPESLTGPCVINPFCFLRLRARGVPIAGRQWEEARPVVALQGRSLALCWMMAFFGEPRLAVEEIITVCGAVNLKISPISHASLLLLVPVVVARIDIANLGRMAQMGCGSIIISRLVRGLLTQSYVFQKTFHAIYTFRFGKNNVAYWCS